MLEPCFYMFLKENRQDPPITQPIPTDTQFVSFWSPGIPQGGTEQLTKTSCGLNMWKPSLPFERTLKIPDWGTTKGFDHSPRFMVCCPCCEICEPKKALSSFSFKFHSFAHKVHVFIGAYSTCSQDEQGGIQYFIVISYYLYFAVKRNSCILTCSPAIHFPCKTRPAFSRSCSKSHHPTM